MHTLPCVTPSLAESTPHPEDTPPHNNPSAYIEEVEPDNDLYTQREIMADPLKLRGPAQFLALLLTTILKFKTLSLYTMKLCYWTMAFRIDLPPHPVVALMPAYPQPWYLPCHMHLQHPLWIPSQHLLWLMVFTCPMQHNVHQLRNLDDQAVPPMPLPPGDTMMTICHELDFRVLYAMSRLCGDKWRVMPICVDTSQMDLASATQGW